MQTSMVVREVSACFILVDIFFFQSSKVVFQQFPKFLSNATKEQPLVIMLDSLDQLSPLHGARKLSWFPRKLPAHVKFIVSTLPDQEYKCFPTLKVLHEIYFCRIVLLNCQLLGGVVAAKWFVDWILGWVVWLQALASIIISVQFLLIQCLSLPIDI